MLTTCTSFIEISAALHLAEDEFGNPCPVYAEVSNDYNEEDLNDDVLAGIAQLHLKTVADSLSCSYNDLRIISEAEYEVALA